MRARIKNFIARNKNDRGVIPPQTFRLALMIAYLDLVRRGVKAFCLYYHQLLYSKRKFLQNNDDNDNNDNESYCCRRRSYQKKRTGTTTTAQQQQQQALINTIFLRDIKALLSVYTLDFLSALIFKWIAQHKVSMFHIYQHHVPTIIIMGGLAIMDMSLSSSQGDRDDDSKVWKKKEKYYKMCRFSIWTGLVINICEVFSIFRTFLRNPDGRTCKIIQALLGISMMGASCGIGTITCGKALIEKYRDWNTSTTTRINMIDVVLSAGMYHCLWNQPRFTLRHYRKLLKVLRM